MKKSETKTICTNKKATHDYFVQETYECGIVLQGSEIKSIKNNKASIIGSFAIVEKNEVWLIDSNIDPYKNANSFPHQPKRKRKLLLHKNEIRKIKEKSEINGFALIPLKIYISSGRAKIELAVCKGKQLHDKREAQKQKDAQKEIQKYKVFS